MVKPYKKQILQNGVIQYSFRYDVKQDVIVVERDATEFCKDIKKKLKAGGLSAHAYFSYYYPEIGRWMPSLGVLVGEAIHAYNPQEEYGKEFTGDECKGIKHFDIYIRPFEIKGGISEHNDCFFDALFQAVQGKTIYLPDKMRTRANMKKALQLNRDELIGINDVINVDELMKNHKIIVSGDIDYISSKACNLVIKLKLYKGHYTLQSDTNRKTHTARHAITGKEIVYSVKKNYISRTVSLYDGNETTEVSFKEYRSMTYQTGKYIFLYSDTTLEETYNKRVEQRTELYKASNGKIDLFHYVAFSDCILDTFKNYSKTLQEPEPITPEEAIFISNAFGGGLMYAESFEGQIYGYDVNSMYPSLLSTHRFWFPVKQGKFKTITEKEFTELSYYKCGIYHSHIDVVEDMKMLFRFNSKDYYTHSDLTRAKELKLKITIICDGQANVLQYDKTDLVAGDNTFLAYVNLLYPMKLKGCKSAKDMLNLLYGLLCQKNTRRKVVSNDEEDDRDENEKITTICPIGKSEGSKYNQFEYTNTRTVYKTNYARLGPFLTAYCRMTLSRTMEPFKAQIKRVHTDAFYITKELSSVDIDIGAGLGQFKLETKKTGHCIIKNVRDMKFIKK